MSSFEDLNVTSMDSWKGLAMAAICCTIVFTLYMDVTMLGQKYTSNTFGHIHSLWESYFR